MSYSVPYWKQFDRMDIFLEKVASRETYYSWEMWYEKHCFSTYTNYFYSNIVNYPKTDIINLKENKWFKIYLFHSLASCNLIVLLFYRRLVRHMNVRLRIQRIPRSVLFEPASEFFCSYRLALPDLKVFSDF